MNAGADDASRKMDDPDPGAWLRQAQALHQDGQIDEARVAVDRAVSLWPDRTPLLHLQLRLAQQAGDLELMIRLLRRLVADEPDDPWLNSEIGARLSQTGRFEQAIPFLRIAAPVLPHENCTLWNYTTALIVTGQYRELLDSQPLLDRMAAQDASRAYPPYCHLAAGRLALSLEPAQILNATRLKVAAFGLDAHALHDRLVDGIDAGKPLSLVRLDAALARLACFTSLRAHLVLRPVELAAVVDSVWPDWFGSSIDTVAPAAIAALGRGLADAIRRADIVGLPDPAGAEADHANQGFLAEMYRLMQDDHQMIVAPDYAICLHAAVPFLRPLLQGLPFLGVIGSHVGLAARLRQFCNIEHAVETVLPASGMEMQQRLAGLEDALATLEVPRPGAVFLVSAPGPYALLFCDRIRSLGGIGLDLGPVMERWIAR